MGFFNGLSLISVLEIIYFIVQGLAVIISCFIKSLESLGYLKKQRKIDTAVIEAVSSDTEVDNFVIDVALCILYYIYYTAIYIIYIVLVVYFCTTF